MKRKQFAARIWSKLIAFETQEALFRRGDRVLAAVSGGPDSVCLAHYLAQLRRRKGIHPFILHIHHGLRGRAADQDALFVASLGFQLGIPVSAVRAPVAARAKARGKGLEDAGRELRYEALVKAARRLRCRKVATGHHLDDQAESVLLHLLRGTRLKALGAMAPRRRLKGRIELVRPLLPLTRAEIRTYLEIHGLESRTDKTNADEHFTRNWIRRSVLPLLASRNPRIREHLAGIAAQARAL